MAPRLPHWQSSALKFASLETKFQLLFDDVRFVRKGAEDAGQLGCKV
jgi:hypothetical protein